MTRILFHLSLVGQLPLFSSKWPCTTTHKKANSTLRHTYLGSHSAVAMPIWSRLDLALAEAQSVTVPQIYTDGMLQEILSSLV